MERLTPEEKQAVELAVMGRINFLEKGKTIAVRMAEIGPYDEARELRIVQLEKEIVTLWAAIRKL